MNGIGYQLLRGGKPREAIEIFRANVELYPNSANTYDSLAEAYEVVGGSARAADVARQTLEAIPRDATLTDAGRENFRRGAEARVRRFASPSGSDRP